eukprot:gene9271-8337_t
MGCGASIPSEEEPQESPSLPGDPWTWPGQPVLSFQRLPPPTEWPVSAAGAGGGFCPTAVKKAQQSLPPHVRAPAGLSSASAAAATAWV